MEERVSTITGNIPVLLVCPHGHDDKNTAFITEKCTEKLGNYALINHGWKRSHTVDEINSFADCNSIKHVMNEKNFVVNDEYGKEFVRISKKIEKKWGSFLIFHIHGIGNHIKQKVTDDIHYVVGFGKSKKKPSFSCALDYKNLFIHFVNKQSQGSAIVYQGKAGGNYSGRHKDNMNQYYRQYEYEEDIHSMQLEIIYDIRSDKILAERTGNFLCDCIDKMINYEGDIPSVLVKEI